MTPRKLWLAMQHLLGEAQHWQYGKYCWRICQVCCKFPGVLYLVQMDSFTPTLSAHCRNGLEPACMHQHNCVEMLEVPPMDLI